MTDPSPEAFEALNTRYADALIRINELTQRVAALEKCCSSYPNGPQWGHEWSCPKCPD